MSEGSSTRENQGFSFPFLRCYRSRLRPSWSLDYSGSSRNNMHSPFHLLSFFFFFPPGLAGNGPWLAWASGRWGYTVSPRMTITPFNMRHFLRLLFFFFSFSLVDGLAG
ncbi:hypothetical protein B0I37DRAFT_122611 [Chaetomium sp. MPI-CAGE-AT-0009]|nr:hypothetical protein B0I37DRAFT_122611 [Chaetomium sp. MPI-CAGE-AT-0009]